MVCEVKEAKGHAVLAKLNVFLRRFAVVLGGVVGEEQEETREMYDLTKLLLLHETERG